MNLTTAELRSMGFSVKDGKAVPIAQGHASPSIRTEAATPAQRRGNMNKLESSFAALLDSQVASGEIKCHSFEVFKVRIASAAKGAWYTPDFCVVGIGGEITFYEVKGFWREAARLRVKVAADRTPWARFVVATRKRGEWNFEEVGR